MPSGILSSSVPIGTVATTAFVAVLITETVPPLLAT